MLRSLSLVFIGLFFGAGLGFLVAASNEVTLDGHDHAAPHTMADDHSHNQDQAITLADDGTAPTISITLHEDGASWNLQIETTNFKFSPEHVNGGNTDGEGHAHIYVNGEKLRRAYGPWEQITSLPKGEVTLSVGLYANDHSVLKVGETVLADQVILTVE